MTLIFTWLILLLSVCE